MIKPIGSFSIRYVFESYLRNLSRTLRHIWEVDSPCGVNVVPCRALWPLRICFESETRGRGLTWLDQVITLSDNTQLTTPPETKESNETRRPRFWPNMREAKVVFECFLHDSSYKAVSQTLSLTSENMPKHVCRVPPVAEGWLESYCVEWLNICLRKLSNSPAVTPKRAAWHRTAFWSHSVLSSHTVRDPYKVSSVAEAWLESYWTFGAYPTVIPC